MKNAKLSQEIFSTTILSSYTVNGSKYKPGHWEKNIFEVVTSDGVFISATDLNKYKNKTIKVTSNKNNPDIGWIWLNYKDDINENISNQFYEIQEALLMNVPKCECYVYKLEIGNEFYVGFTSQKPEKRIEAHILSSENGAMQKINIALRKWGYMYEFEIIGKYPNEILGLVSEIKNIEKFESKLNESIGGQGKDFNIVTNKNKYNEDIFYVHDKNDILKQS